MPTSNPEDEVVRRAREQVEAKKWFYGHGLIYLVVNLGLVLMWAISTHGFPWFFWSLMGWGIGLLFHYLGVFGIFRAGSAWEEKQVEKETQRLKKRAG
jgi:hypothetical protein